MLRCVRGGPRWAVVLLTLVLGWSWTPRWAAAEDLLVPARLQAALAAKVVTFDRSFATRVKHKVLVAVLSKPGDADSERAAAQMVGAFRELGPIGGLPHEVLPIAWTDAVSLAAACTQRKVTLLYLTPGLDKEAAPIVKALEGARVLTVTGALAYVKFGVVLGFDLVSGRPKLVINLTSAKREGFAFDANFLAITRVVQ